MRERGQALADQVARYVSEHMAAPITLENLARHVGVSKYHLNRLFEAATGFSLGEYIQRRRMQRACYLLSLGNFSVIDVALAVGYESHSAFSRAFHKAFQRQPSEVGRGEVSDNPIPLRAKPAGKILQPEVLTLPEQCIPGFYGQGFDENSFSAVADVLFKKVYEVLRQAGVSNPVAPHIGVSLDSPWQGDHRVCRFFAGIELQDSVKGLDSYIQPAGRWAKFIHRGEYRLIWQSVSQIYAAWVLPKNIPLRDQAIVQRYCNDPRETPVDELVTELYFAF